MDSRSYSGKLMRPTPEVHIEADGSFGAVITPWGSRAGIKRAIETLSDFIQSAKNDMEATSPFQKLTCISPAANTLRAAIMLTNDILYREENKSEYLSGIELLAFSNTGEELSFVQIGQPHVLLHRRGQPLMTLGAQMDLAQEWSRDGRPAPPLPNNVLGLQRTSNFQVISFKPMPGDALIAISRSRIPASLLQLEPHDLNLDSMSRLLAAEDPEQPFWVGIQPLEMTTSSDSTEDVA